MTDYSRIDTMIRATVFSKPKKIAICPFAEAGMMAKQILNQRYGIEEAYIIDNRLAEINPKILSVEDLRGEDCDNLVVLLMIQNKEINQVLENQLKELDNRIEIQNYLKPAWMLPPEKREYFRQLKNCLKVELPPWGQALIRLGQAYDGGYVLADDFTSDMHVYSFGIANDVSFELDLAKRGLQIYLHDHTISQLPEEHENFCFRKLGISHIDELHNQKLSLETLLAMNQDLENDQLILKMDVEGAEWDFLANVPAQILSRFRQITFELHRLTDIRQSGRILGGLEKLNMTHQLVWIHANNFGHIERAENGLEIPAYVEVTYLNRAVYHTRKGSCCFPLAMDMPDCPSVEEYILGEWGEP